MDRAASSSLADFRPIIVAENASARFGGEAILPLHYFRFLRKRGVEAWLVAHERNREEVTELLGADVSRARFVVDRLYQRARYKLSSVIARSPFELPLDMALSTITQADLRSEVLKLVREFNANVVHLPTPVSPKAPSLMFDVGAPVVIGPMNGGMTYPPGFARFQSEGERRLHGLARSASSALQRLMPGKREAATLLVANERTRKALPAGVSTHVVELVENGVDMSLFAPRPRTRPLDAVTRFTFVGRLVDWKAVDLLLEATATALRTQPLELMIIGDGLERANLEAQARALGIAEHVSFKGFLAQSECAKLLADTDALVLPSLYECGGAVVLEAMAMGLPVIATGWGGPADYVTEQTGILVEPSNEQQFSRDLTAALLRLAEAPSLRRAMGAAGRRRVEEHFDWERKIDRILAIYRDAQVRTAAREAARAAKLASPLSSLLAR